MTEDDPRMAAPPDGYVAEGVSADEFCRQIMLATSTAIGPALSAPLNNLTDDLAVNATLAAQAAAVGLGEGLAPSVMGYLNVADGTVTAEEFANVVRGALLAMITELTQPTASGGETVQ